MALSVFALCSALIVAVAGIYQRSRATNIRANELFKTVQDISVEGDVAYQPVQDEIGAVVDFEYRYANPAALAIMKRTDGTRIVGQRLLERLPIAREHPQLFSALRQGANERRDVDGRIRTRRTLGSFDSRQTGGWPGGDGTRHIGAATQRGRSKAAAPGIESSRKEFARLGDHDGDARLRHAAVGASLRRRRRRQHRFANGGVRCDIRFKGTPHETSAGIVIAA